MNACILCDVVHGELAQRCTIPFKLSQRCIIPFKSFEDLNKINKNNQLVEMLALSLDASLVSHVLTPQTPRLLVLGLSTSFEFLGVQRSDDLEKTVTAMQSNAQFRYKEVFGTSMAIVNVRFNLGA